MANYFDDFYDFFDFPTNNIWNDMMNMQKRMRKLEKRLFNEEEIEGDLTKKPEMIESSSNSVVHSKQENENRGNEEIKKDKQKIDSPNDKQSMAVANNENQIVEPKKKQMKNLCWNPKVDLRELENTFEIHAELPGVKKEDISVELLGNENNKRLVLHGKKEHLNEEKNEKYHKIERSFGSFERSFVIPSETKPENIVAKFDNGVLQLSFPKMKSASPIMKIDIK